MVYDVSRRDSYEKLEKWHRAFSSACDAEGVPFVIIGNKADLGSRVNPYQVREEWINAGNADAHFQCSALTNASVEEAFSTVAELAYRH